MNRLTQEELLALPVTVDIETAGRGWGMGRTKSHQLARTGSFPCTVQKIGKRYTVTKAVLLAALGIPWPANAGTPEGTAA